MRIIEDRTKRPPRKCIPEDLEMQLWLYSTPGVQEYDADDDSESEEQVEWESPSIHTKVEIVDKIRKP